MKYMGSKARISKDILPIILKDREPNQWYIEPFAGGMNTICEVSGNRVANDIHPYLIAMWGALINGWIPTNVTREEYNQVSRNQDKYPPHYVGWVGFNCSYSGKWFAGYAGKSKTRDGMRDYQAEAIRNVLKQIGKLHNVIISNLPYNEVILPKNSIIYCDPPYKGTTNYSNEFDHTLFWEWVRQVSKDHTVYVSEYDAPDDFKCIWHKEVNSSLSANGKIGGNKKSMERLFIKD